MNAPVGPAAMGDPWTTPIEQIDVADARIFQDDVWYDWFARLRRDDPVHCTAESQFGPYWSVTRYKDIMRVETNPQVFSSASGITLLDQETQYRLASFIAMDPPKHDVQRLVVAPIVAPGNLANLAGTIRQRVIRILDGLPRNETFDWVEHVSVELTTQMLATLFDYPLERASALAHLEWQREERPAQHQADPQSHACLQRPTQPGREGRGVAQAVACVACGR